MIFIYIFRFSYFHRQDTSIWSRFRLSLHSLWICFSHLCLKRPMRHLPSRTPRIFWNWLKITEMPWFWLFVEILYVLHLPHTSWKPCHVSKKAFNESIMFSTLFIVIADPETCLSRMVSRGLSLKVSYHQFPVLCDLSPSVAPCLWDSFLAFWYQ